MEWNSRGLLCCNWSRSLFRLFFCLLIGFVQRGVLCRNIENVLEARPRSCQPIYVEMCKDLPYHGTVYPDIGKGYSGQKRGEEELIAFKPLLQKGCSPYLRVFLCSHYVPMCSPDYLDRDDDPRPVPPCRAVCEEVRSQCAPLMEKHSFLWPFDLECSKFPKNGTDDKLCIPLSDFAKHLASLDAGRPLVTSSSVAASALDPTDALATVQCPAKFTLVASRRGTLTCAPECYEHVKFGEDEKYNTEFVMAILAAFGVMLNMAMVLTFAIAKQRFTYPERPVIYVAISFVVFGAAHFIRLFGGRGLSCGTANEVRHIVFQSHNQSSACVVQFFFIYFAFHSACVWWVILAVSWFLAASKKWSSEAIQSVSKYFVMTSLGVPSALSLAVIFWGKIDADELSGMCGVGNLDREGLLTLVLLPLVCYLFSGGSLVVMAIISSLTVRRIMRSSGCEERISKMICKMGLYSLLFILTIAILAACASVQLVTWSHDTSPADGKLLADPVMYLRILLPLLLGVLSTGWIFNRKTIKSWCEFGKLCSRLDDRKKPVNANERTHSAVPLLTSTSCPMTPWQTPMSSVAPSGVTKWTHSACGSDRV